MFFLKIIEKLFKKPKVLVIVRAPINSFATYTRNKKIKAKRTREIIKGDYLHFLYNIYKFREIKSKIYCINLEELHKEPKKSIESMCTKIGLNFNKTLLQSTFNGKLWFNPRKFVYNGFNFKYHDKINYDELNKDVCNLIDDTTKNFQIFLGYLDKNDKINKSKFPLKSFINYIFYLIYFFIFKLKNKNIYSLYNLFYLKFLEIKNFNKKIKKIKNYDLKNEFKKKIILINKNTHKFKRG